MGIDHAPHQASRHTRASAKTPLTAARPAKNLVDAVIALQHTAGNLAVASELAPLQRDDAPTAAGAEKDTPQAVAELWPNSMMGRLAEAKQYLATDPQRAWETLSHAVEFIEDAMEVVPRDHPTWAKLRILGITLDGIRNVLADRLKNTGAADVSIDLRFSYREAADIGPELPAPPGPAGAAGGQVDIVERWNQAAVYPIGRSILNVYKDTKVAMSEASAALEVVNVRRTALPTGHPAKLRVITLERTLKYAVERLQQAAGGPAELDTPRDLDTTIEEARVIGGVLATTPRKSVPVPAAPKKPFVNDTELLRPGD